MPDFIRHHFNAITLENVLKREHVQPAPGEFQFSEADTIVHFARENHRRAYTGLAQTNAPIR